MRGMFNTMISDTIDNKTLHCKNYNNIADRRANKSGLFRKMAIYQDHFQNIKNKIKKIFCLFESSFSNMLLCIRETSFVKGPVRF